MFLFLPVDKGQATTILADVYVESFGNIEEANMVTIMLFLWRYWSVELYTLEFEIPKFHSWTSHLPTNVNIHLNLALAIFC